MTKPLIGIGTDIQPGEGKGEVAFAFLSYVDSVLAAGGLPVLIPPQPGNAALILEQLDGVVLTGGPDCDPAAYGEARHPTVVKPLDGRRQANELALARAARELGVPALGVCLGLQLMNVSAGGSLIQDIRSQHSAEIAHSTEPGKRVRHAVSIDADTRLSSILGAGETEVNSSHHQAVRRIAPGLRRNAVAPDGVIEGIEDPSHPFFVGVQWHPEDMKGEDSSSALFGAFVAEARRRAYRRAAATDLSPAGAAASE